MLNGGPAPEQIKFEIRDHSRSPVTRPTTDQSYNWKTRVIVLQDPHWDKRNWSNVTNNKAQQILSLTTTLLVGSRSFAVQVGLSRSPLGQVKPDYKNISWVSTSFHVQAPGLWNLPVFKLLLKKPQHFYRKAF